MMPSKNAETRNLEARKNFVKGAGQKKSLPALLARELNGAQIAV